MRYTQVPQPYPNFNTKIWKAERWHVLNCVHSSDSTSYKRIGNLRALST